MWSFLFIREYMKCLVLLRKDALFTCFCVFFGICMTWSFHFLAVMAIIGLGCVFKPQLDIMMNEHKKWEKKSRLPALFMICICTYTQNGWCFLLSDVFTPDTVL